MLSFGLRPARWCNPDMRAADYSDQDSEKGRTVGGHWRWAAEGVSLCTKKKKVDGDRVYLLPS